MKRICLVGAAVAGLFTAGITTAASATTPTYKTVTVTETTTKVMPKTASTTVTCKPSLSVQVPAGETAVQQGAGSGTLLGNSACGTPLYAGITQMPFALDPSGDLAGKLAQWFRTGTIVGTYDISPSESSAPPSGYSFTQASYAGTVTITGGTEGLKGTTGKGTLSCSTLDSAHYTCAEKLSLTQTVDTIVKVPKKVTVKIKVS